MPIIANGGAMNILVIGAGAWGTTLATLVARAGNTATLFCRHPEVYVSLNESRRHPVSLSGFSLPVEIDVVDDLVDALGSNPALIIVAVPTSGVEQVARILADCGYLGVIASATKGIDPETLRTSTQRIIEVTGNRERVAALSGPNLATEIAGGLPAAAVVASTRQQTAQLVQRGLMSPTFRIYTSSDIVGVELAGALKNVMAIGAGIADGLTAGQNAKAAFITRGIAEITRLGMACGADPMTFAGLAGIGDLMATCGSTLSRNHTVGRRLAEGELLRDIIATMTEVAEGVPTTRAAIALGERLGVELPIATQIGNVLFNNVSPHHAIAQLLARDAAPEVRPVDLRGL
jgi:glycerol-3-phosphate dehydrogenase (NAD(P)+)